MYMYTTCTCIYCIAGNLGGGQSIRGSVSQFIVYIRGPSSVAPRTLPAIR